MTYHTFYYIVMDCSRNSVGDRLFISHGFALLVFRLLSVALNGLLDKWLMSNVYRLHSYIMHLFLLHYLNYFNA